MAPWTASDFALQIAYQPATSKQKTLQFITQKLPKQYYRPGSLEFMLLAKLHQSVYNSSTFCR